MKDEKTSRVLGLTCFRKRNLRNMFKKESCSLQKKTGKQFKESNQKKVTPISPGRTKHGRFFLGLRWNTSSLSLCTKKSQKHCQDTEDGNHLSAFFSGAPAHFRKSHFFFRRISTGSCTSCLHCPPLAPEIQPQFHMWQNQPCTSFACTSGSWHFTESWHLPKHRALQPPQ